MSYSNRNLQESITRGEKDIQEGRMTVCKNIDEVDLFFASI